MRFVKKRAAPVRDPIHFATGGSALGTVLVAWSGCGICALLLGEDPELMATELRRRFAGTACLQETTGNPEQLVQALRFLESPHQECSFALDPHGTAFQLRVWEALATVPAGTTTTYSELAEQLNVPGGARAIAAACAANPVAVAIPCHRVIRRNGSLAGYRWGVERKAALLAQESCVLAL